MPVKIAISRAPSRVSRTSAFAIADLSLVKSRSSATSTAAVITRARSRDGITSARTAPTPAPTVTGTATISALRQGIARLRWKEPVADIAPISTGRRFVALAVTGSRPIAISSGSDTADPEDAAVFRKPQAKPARPANASAQISVSTASSVGNGRD